MDRRYEFEDWWKEKAEEGALPKLDVRAFNIICRNVYREDIDVGRSYINVIADWTDEKLLSLRGLGKKTFEIAKQVRDEASDCVHGHPEIAFICKYRPDYMQIARRDTHAGLELYEWWKKRRFKSELSLVQAEDGTYVAPMYAENAVDAAAKLIDIIDYVLNT